MTQVQPSRALVGEAVGTFVLVAAGGLAIALDADGAALGPIGVALVFGLAVASMIIAFGPTSGAHFNPAVSLAFASRKAMSLRLALAYVVVQVAAASAAASCIAQISPAHAAKSVTLPHAGTEAALAYEFVATFVLVLVILTIVDRGTRPLGAGAAIGATVSFGALGGAVSGASMNPARSLGPAFVFGPMGDQWIYVLAPCAGAVTAVALRGWIARGEVPPGA